uniref:Uncharacterized protein n=1 Tax=Loxodonta africana TaxID=9785 RepID=G3SPX4_LOXAF
TKSLTRMSLPGLSLGQRIQVQPGESDPPQTWAEPDSVIAWGNPVTNWCQGTLEAKKYHLYREGCLAPWDTQNPPEPNKAKFFVSQLTELTAGQYHCYYCSCTGYSAHSVILELVVTEAYSKPTVLGLPSPVVIGGNVTLQCGSWQGYDKFILSQEGEHKLSTTLDSQPHSSGDFQALFPVSPMTTSYRWTFRCYRYYETTLQVWSDPSDTLELLVSAVEGSPSSLLTQWGPIVASAESLILQCHSDVKYDRFTLSKEGTRDLPQGLGWQPQRGNSQVDFPLGRVNRTHKGQYSGYNLSQEWLVPSDPLDILVAGKEFQIPSLSAHSAPDVASGENVTLQCHSWSSMDTFLLSKEAGVDSPLHLRSVHQAGMNQAYFTMGPVTSGHMGTYRRYGSLSISPYLLSYSSGPLNLKVSEEHGGGWTLSSGPWNCEASTSKSYTVGNCVRMGLAGMVLLIPVVILAEAGNSQCRSQHGCMG